MADVFDFYVYDDRRIEFTTTEPILLEDNGVTDFKFRIPKVLNGIDMSGFAWWFVFANAERTTYSESLTLSDDEDDPDNYMTATYTVDYGMTIKAGTVFFSIEAINTDGTEIVNEWHTLTYRLTVYDTLQGNQAEYSETESDVISALIVELQTRVRQLVGGAVPTPVSSTSAMTDTTTIYLNTTDGYWYYYNGSAWTAGGVYASGLTVDDEPTEDSTNLITSGAVYDLKEDFEQNFEQLEQYWYAGEIAQTGTGFVSTAGAVTSNSNYKYLKYALHDGTQSIRVDSIYVGGSSSAYAVFAFFDASDELISYVHNTTINTTSSGNTFTNVDADVPTGASYVLITFGNMSSSTTFSTVMEYGFYKPTTDKRVFNNGLNSSNRQFFYFHTEATNISGYTSLAFNAKLHTVLPVQNYEVYFTGYNEGKTTRTFATYKTGLTKGIDGNDIVIAENFQNTSANDISGCYWIGVVINLLYADASLETGVEGLRQANTHAVTSEYCVLNGVALTNAQYPASGYTTLTKPYTEPYNPLYGGFLCTIGDSLTAVYYKSEEESWPYLIAKWNNMQYENKGVSGMPLAQNTSYAETCMCDIVDGLSNTKYYTHIFVMGGANDYNAGTEIGTNTDTAVTTFKGAVNHIIATLTDKFPNAHIVFGTTYRRNASYLDKPYADAMLEVCALHSIPCLNNYENSGVQMFDSNWMEIFGATNALGNNHLNAAGDLFVAPRIEHALKYGIF